MIFSYTEKDLILVQNKIINYIKLPSYSPTFPHPGTSSKARDPAQYQGGEVRNLTEDNSLAIALYFQGANWKSADGWALQLAATLLNGNRLNACK